jgi:hypothetical protein
MNSDTPSGLEPTATTTTYDAEVPGLRAVEDPLSLTSPEEDSGLVEGWSIPAPTFAPFATGVSVPGQAGPNDALAALLGSNGGNVSEMSGGLLPGGLSGSMASLKDVRDIKSMLTQLTEMGRAARVADAAPTGLGALPEGSRSLLDINARLSLSKDYDDVATGVARPQLVDKPPLGYAVCNEAQQRGIGKSCPLNELLAAKEPIFLLTSGDVAYPIEMLQRHNADTPLGDVPLEKYTADMETRYRRLLASSRALEESQFMAKLDVALQYKVASQSRLGLSLEPGANGYAMAHKSFVPSVRL